MVHTLVADLVVVRTWVVAACLVVAVRTLVADLVVASLADLVVASLADLAVAFVEAAYFVVELPFLERVASPMVVVRLILEHHFREVAYSLELNQTFLICCINK